MPSSSPLLVAEDLTRMYAPDAGVAGVNLEVQPGEVLGLIGPNGGGKSTLLMLLAGLIRPYESLRGAAGDAATQSTRHWPERLELDCFATLAMTDVSSAPRIAEQMDMQPVAHPEAVLDA